MNIYRGNVGHLLCQTRSSIPSCDDLRLNGRLLYSHTVFPCLRNTFECCSAKLGRSTIWREKKKCVSWETVPVENQCIKKQHQVDPQRPREWPTGQFHKKKKAQLIELCLKFRLSQLGKLDLLLRSWGQFATHPKGVFSKVTLRRPGSLRTVAEKFN